jgi:hypothetical protein
MLIHASFGSPKQSAALVFVLAQAWQQHGKPLYQETSLSILSRQ